MNSGKPDISIVGAGVVVTALGVLAVRAGYRVVAVASRTEASAAKAVRVIGQGEAFFGEQAADAAGRGELVLLTVNDDAIADVAEQLARAKAVGAGAVVAHRSGVLGSVVLAPLQRECGAAVASMHPLQTFPSVLAAVDALAGCYFFCEGDSPAVSAVMQLAGDIGGVTVEIEADRKALYHAAACMACNYLATLQEAAISAAVLAGIGTLPARQALAPLVAATVANINDLGPGPALTGPIARGDNRTVARHLQALDAVEPELAALYRTLGRRTVELARQAGKIDQAAATRLLQVLS